jgi:hypothetical protein
MATVSNTRTFSQAVAEADLPVKVTREDIAKLGLVTWDYAEEAQARNPSSGEMGDGYMVYLHDAKGNKMMTFVGNVVLVGMIRGKVDPETGEVQQPGIQFPFTARLVKDHDRTWVWSD